MERRICYNCEEVVAFNPDTGQWEHQYANPEKFGQWFASQDQMCEATPSSAILL